MKPEVDVYGDYHELLADASVDAVIIATPDHWHAKMLMDAANAKKGVYVEKGWTRSIAEAKAMRAAVKQNDIIMQLGHQSRESAAGMQASRLIAEGALGPVTLVRIGRFENRPLGMNVWRWYGDYNQYVRPEEAQVKKDVDWKRWLGDTPVIPFNMERFWHWRCYWDYGTGVAGDLLSHEIDFVQSVLRHGIPDTCICAGLNALLDDGREVPDTWNTIYHFEQAGRTVSFDCSMNSNGMIQVPEFYGKEAVLQCNGIAQDVSDFVVYPESSSVKYGPQIEAGKITPGKPFMRFDTSKTPEQPTHMEDFFNGVRNHKKTKCNEDEAFIEASTILMSVAALKEKREVRWNRDKEDIV